MNTAPATMYPVSTSDTTPWVPWETFVERMHAAQHDAIPDTPDDEHLFHMIDGLD